MRIVTISEKLVLRNQRHWIYTWKDFPLAIYNSFKYTRGWCDFEIPQCLLLTIAIIINEFQYSMCYKCDLLES